MHIGLIGGIGVAATVVYYQRLAATVAAKGKPLELTIVQADASTLVVNNREDNRTAQAEIYARLIDRLKAAGAECAAITSLGGHFCYDETVTISSLPLVSGVAPLDAYFVSQGLGRVGLLGTRVVMATKLYGQLRRTKAVAIEDELDTLGQRYIDMALSGTATEADRRYFLDAGQRLADDRGADAVVLAGTDLNLAFDGQTTDYRVIDALEVHVDLLARLACDDVALSELETSG